MNRQLFIFRFSIVDIVYCTAIGLTASVVVTVVVAIVVGF